MLEIRHEHMSSFEDLQRGYDEIYLGKGIQLRDSFYLWAINLLKPKPGRLLIDISCGQGRLPILARRLGLQAVGVDFSIQGLIKGRISCDEVSLVAGDGERLPITSACADYITHTGNLEHYQNPSFGAQEIFRILKPGGLACIILPNAFGLFGNFQYVAMRGDIYDDDQPLQRYATRNCWETILTNTGMKILHVQGWEGVEFPKNFSDVRFFLENPPKIIKLFIQPLIPVNLANHLVFLCTRD